MKLLSLVERNYNLCCYPTRFRLTYSIFINLTLEILRMLRLQYLERRLYYFLKTNGETNDNRLVKYFVRWVKISYIDSANFCRMVHIECYRIDLCRLTNEDCFLINFLALEHSSFQKSTMNYSLYRPYSHNFFRRNDAFDICLGFSLASNQIV